MVWGGEQDEEKEQEQDDQRLKNLQICTDRSHVGDAMIT